MFVQLATGTAIVTLTIIVIAAFIGAAILILTRVGEWFVSPPRLYKTIVSLIGVVLWLLAALTAWVWAAALMGLGIFESFETGLYFVVVAFTTLGFGDITPPQEWRLLSGICSANGLLLFGLSTAFLVDFFRQQAQDFEHQRYRHQRGIARHVERWRDFDHVTADKIEPAQAVVAAEFDQHHVRLVPRQRRRQPGQPAGRGFAGHRGVDHGPAIQRRIGLRFELPFQ